jgi:hypothetical protein
MFMHVPASMKAKHYAVRVAILSYAPPKRNKILKVCCGCPAAAGGHCTHGAALLFAIANLQRPAASGKVQIATSMLCRWNVPSDGKMFSVLLPIELMCFKHEDVNAPFKKQVRGFTSSEHSRSSNNPFRSDIWWAPDMKSAEISRVRQVFFDGLSARTGVKCAAELNIHNEHLSREDVCRQFEEAMSAKKAKRRRKS